MMNGGRAPLDIAPRPRDRGLLKCSASRLALTHSKLLHIRLCQPPSLDLLLCGTANQPRTSPLHPSNQGLSTRIDNDVPSAP